jgi:hypothetical protein
MIARCAICGSAEGVQNHHIGGQKHAPFFVMSLCSDHHERVTGLIRQAGGIEVMKYTSDLAERARRARLHALVFIWFTDEIVSHAKTSSEGGLE